jgi:hypothetical protein
MRRKQKWWGYLLFPQLLTAVEKKALHLRVLIRTERRRVVVQSNCCQAGYRTRR